MKDDVGGGLAAGLTLVAIFGIIGFSAVASKLGLGFAVPVGIIGAVAGAVILRGPVGHALARRLAGETGGQAGIDEATAPLLELRHPGVQLLDLVEPVLRLRQPPHGVLPGLSSDPARERLAHRPLEHDHGHYRETEAEGAQEWRQITGIHSTVLSLSGSNPAGFPLLSQQALGEFEPLLHLGQTVLHGIHFRHLQPELLHLGAELTVVYP